MKDGEFQIRLGDIYSGQERNILIKLSAPTNNLGQRQLLTASLRFTDIIGDRKPVGLQKELTYEVTEDVNKVASNENKEVTAREVSVDAAYQMYQATTYYEKGDFDNAVENIKKALGRNVGSVARSGFRTGKEVNQRLQGQGAAKIGFLVGAKPNRAQFKDRRVFYPGLKMERRVGIQNSETLQKRVF